MRSNSIFDEAEQTCYSVQTPTSYAFSALFSLRRRANALAFAFFVAMVGSLSWSGAAYALTCPAYTYSFSNGATADATQVNSNFTTIMSCANTLLAPLSGPSFTHSLAVTGTITDATDGDTVALATFLSTISPTADSGANTPGILVTPTYETAHNFFETGVNAPTAAVFQNLVDDMGTVADISGADFFGLWAGGAATTLGTVSSVQAAEFSPIVSFSNSRVGHICNRLPIIRCSVELLVK